jgi:hypothetical protein
LPAISPKYTPRHTTRTADELERILRELMPDDAARAAFIVATGAELRATKLAEDKDVSLAAVHLHGTKRTTRERVVPLVLPWQRSLMEHALRFARGRYGKFFANGDDEFRWALRYRLPSRWRRSHDADRLAPHVRDRAARRWRAPRHLGYDDGPRRYEDARARLRRAAGVQPCGPFAR